MQTITISTTYSLKWAVKNYPNYFFTEKGVLINSRTSRIIKRVVNGGSIGYWFGKDFKPLNELRKELIKLNECPF